MAKIQHGLGKGLRKDSVPGAFGVGRFIAFLKIQHLKNVPFSFQPLYVIFIEEDAVQDVVLPFLGSKAALSGQYKDQDFFCDSAGIMDRADPCGIIDDIFVVFVVPFAAFLIVIDDRPLVFGLGKTSRLDHPIAIIRRS